MGWSVVQAARSLKISPKFVYDLIKHGYLATERISGKHVISDANFKEYLELYPPGTFPELPKNQPIDRPKRSYQTPEYRAERLKHLKEYARSKGGDCLSEIFQGESIEHEWACQSGHKWFARPRHILIDQTWCKACFLASRRKVKPYRKADQTA